jgi:predicted nucleic acid-binding protein
MEISKRIKGKRIYVDTNILIYLFEGFEEYRHLIQEIADCVDNDEIILLTGEITIAELMVMPFRKNDSKLISLYTTALNDKDFIHLVPTTQTIYLKTAYLRATFSSMKTPDAIQVASAIEGEADIFITNDKGIKTPKEVEKIVLKDYL